MWSTVSLTLWWSIQISKVSYLEVMCNSWPEMGVDIFKCEYHVFNFIFFFTLYLISKIFKITLVFLQLDTHFEANDTSGWNQSSVLPTVWNLLSYEIFSSSLLRRVYISNPLICLDLLFINKKMESLKSAPGECF